MKSLDRRKKSEELEFQNEGRRKDKKRRRHWARRWILIFSSSSPFYYSLTLCWLREGWDRRQAIGRRLIDRKALLGTNIRVFPRPRELVVVAAFCHAGKKMYAKPIGSSFFLTRPGGVLWVMLLEEAYLNPLSLHCCYTSMREHIQDGLKQRS